MQIGIVADTHGHREFTLNAVRMLSSLDVNLVLHCGDVGNAELLELFDQWPLHVVRGNVDQDRELRDTTAKLSLILEPRPHLMWFLKKKSILAD